VALWLLEADTSTVCFSDKACRFRQAFFRGYLAHSVESGTGPTRQYSVISAENSVCKSQVM
jgi:hypothetical protein